MRAMAENMADRKKAILRAVTDDYITTAEPVGSRTIARNYALDALQIQTGSSLLA